ncbi:MFS transporter [Cupriavidus taiwanensis]|uniref:MFS transporter n=1 Tax=Cupriavidus taiwanensis TaxID=164546 RepID=UPI0039C1E165
MANPFGLREARGVSALYFILFLAQGTLIPFLPLWLFEKGLSSAEVARLVSLSFLPKLVGNPIVAGIADRTGALRSLLLVLTCTAFVTFLAYQAAPSFWLMLVPAVLFNLALSAIFPLAELLAIHVGARTSGGYGLLRLWGSLGFAASTLLAGGFVTQWSVHSIPLLVLLALATASMLACRLPASKRTPTSVDRATIPPWRELFGHHRFLLVLCGAALVQASNGYLYSGSGQLWRQQGHTAMAIGTLWTVGIFAEVLFLASVGRFVTSLGSVRMLWLAAAMTTLRWLLMSTTASFPLLCLCQLLQAFTIGANVSAVMAHIGTAAPDGFHARAIAFYFALGMGVFIAIAVNVAEFAVRQYGWSGFCAMGVFSAAAVMIHTTVLCKRSV